MINVGVTWGNRVWMELVCDCVKCADEVNSIKVYGETFSECAQFVKTTKWEIDRGTQKCYAPHHMLAQFVFREVRVVVIATLTFYQNKEENNGNYS